MRIVKVGLVGGGIVAAVLLLSQATSGLWPLVLFAAAVFSGALTIGVMCALLVDVPEHRSSHRRNLHSEGVSHVSSSLDSKSRKRCGVCRRAMRQLGAVWICKRCDMAASQP